MTTRKAKATAATNTGILRCAQDDGFLEGVSENPGWIRNRRKIQGTFFLDLTFYA
jgi:hypothetical protein